MSIDETLLTSGITVATTVCLVLVSIFIFNRKEIEV